METDLQPAPLGPRIGSLGTHRRRASDGEAVRLERAQTRAWLHDRVLQLLEYIATGGYDDEPDARHLMRVAAIGADELRAFIEGDIGTGPVLVEALADVVTEVQLLDAGLRVELVPGRVDAELEPAAVATLAAATREALTNVRRHAAATRAVVTCQVGEREATVSIADDGRGFDVATRPPGAGLRHSIVGRLIAVGGTARVDSRPGAGTTVTLRVVASPWSAVL